MATEVFTVSDDNGDERGGEVRGDREDADDEDGDEPRDVGVLRKNSNFSITLASNENRSNLSRPF